METWIGIQDHLAGRLYDRGKRKWFVQSAEVAMSLFSKFKQEVLVQAEQ